MTRNWIADRVFDWVRDALARVAKVANRIHVEINIIVYFILIPFSWLISIDLILGTRGVIGGLYLLGWLVFIGAQRSSRRRSEWLFHKSVDFLLYFDSIGSNYIISSVLICVFIPVLISCVLLAALFWT